MLKDFTKIKFDIIIAAGQSNCAGSGVGDVEVPFKPKDNLWYMNKNFTISTATEKAEDNFTKGSFVLSFAEEYLKTMNDDRELIIVNSALGATGFEKGMWGKGEPLTCAMLEMTKTVLELNKENKIVAFLWHQGERTINKNIPVDFHKQELRILLDEVIENFGNDFSFITADFAPNWKCDQGEKGVIVAQAIKDVFSEYGGGFVLTDGLDSNSDVSSVRKDNIHFSRKSLYELGKRFYNEFLKLKG